MARVMAAIATKAPGPTAPSPPGLCTTGSGSRWQPAEVAINKKILLGTHQKLHWCLGISEDPESLLAPCPNGLDWEV
jgi:hypothetical protein